MKREKITDMERIEALYKERKISRSTFWRAKKRGYIVLYYHDTQKLSDYMLSKQEQADLYRYCKASAVDFVTLHLKRILDYKEMSSLIEDITHDIFLYIIERQPVNLKQAFKRVNLALKNLSQKPLWYGKYLYMPIRKKEAEDYTFRDLGDLVDSNAGFATML